ncbi:MAG: multidrug transporter [Bacillus thermozeamaize]|uniref:Multidrug transporter n=1 Tax=Bacillus thermozeamaize TaxID=230954 RepID=A0A1Y3PL08_9BACI|nr:MAG: multidrug transporter [Bacillus thermozeamaize]
MEQWKRNLGILWVAQFFVMASMSMIIPFLPLYVQELGVRDPAAVTRWAGFIFGANFFSAFLFAPFWGALADRHGRKIMLLRSGFGMAITISLMGLAATPLQLLLLRFLNGMISGFIPAATSLMAVNTPKDKTGQALGILQSGTVAGTIMGPFLGGLLAEWIGFRQMFHYTGMVILAMAVLVWIGVREDFVKPTEGQQKAMKGSFSAVMRTQPLLALFAVGFMIQFAIMSAQPLLPLFVQEVHPTTQYVAFYAGLVPAVTGMANMLASPFLGRLGDRKGTQYVLFYSLLGATLFCIPQAFVHSIGALLVTRFLLGLCIGGLLPSVNALIRKFSPPGQESTTYGYCNSALFMGNMLGPILGGVLAGVIGIRGVFLLGAVLFAINTMWVKYVFEHRVDESRRLRLRKNLLPR